MTQRRGATARAAFVAAARQFGYRNLIYLAFVAALFPLALAMDPGPIESEDGLGTALALWAAVSLAFFPVNAVPAVIAGARGRPLARPLIGCGLPVFCVLIAFALMPAF